MISSLTTLLFTNFVPIIGILFFKWDFSSLFLAFWLETVVIGVINVFKMLKVQEKKTEFHFAWLMFYIFHFGLFCYALLIFSNKYLYITDFSPLVGLTSVVTFVFSHLHSYYQNYIKKKEYMHVSFEGLTFQPYKRIVAMHLGFGLTAVLIGLNRNTIWGMVLIVLVKSFFDVWTHVKEHKLKW